MVELFSDLNSDGFGRMGALIESADGPIEVGDEVIIRDEEDDLYDAVVTEISKGCVYFEIKGS